MPRQPTLLCEDEMLRELVHAARLFDDSCKRVWSNALQKAAWAEALRAVAADALHTVYSRQAWDAEGFEPIANPTSYRGLEIAGESLVGRIALEGNTTLLFDALLRHGLDPTRPALCLSSLSDGSRFHLSPMGHFIAQGGSPLALAWRDMLPRPDGFSKTFPEWDATSEVRQSLAVLRHSSSLNFEDVKLDALFCSTVCIALKRATSFDPDVLFPFTLKDRFQEEPGKLAAPACQATERGRGPVDA